ncbi:MAG: hypothetical protein LBG45_01990 [Dysgonamonadaceae bacterium]|jgi:hypothetical protein|nr:hypothetical protein [Dysgonamonadaceae bacterium]
MELKDFIATTIKQITNGLTEGHKYVQENISGSEGVHNSYTAITFDVAVTTNEEEKDKLGGKISVVQIFSGGASIENSNTTTNYSRIQFKIRLHINTSNK